MIDTPCPHCRSYLAEYLLKYEWIDDLNALLCRAENEHIAHDVHDMTDLELWQLYRHLHRNSQTDE